jgi:hypothetical protein
LNRSFSKDSRIENGSYQIKPDKIADKMIRESLLNDLFK